MTSCARGSIVSRVVCYCFIPGSDFVRCTPWGVQDVGKLYGPSNSDCVTACGVSRPYYGHRIRKNIVANCSSFRARQSKYLSSPSSHGRAHASTARLLFFLIVISIFYVLHCQITLDLSMENMAGLQACLAVFTAIAPTVACYAPSDSQARETESTTLPMAGDIAIVTNSGGAGTKTETPTNLFLGRQLRLLMENASGHIGENACSVSGSERCARTRHKTTVIWIETWYSSAATSF